MDVFRKILFVTKPNDDPSEGLKQALILAKNNHAALRVVVAASQLPEKLTSYNQAYIKSLEEKIQGQLDDTLAQLGLSREDVALTQDVLPVDKFAVDVIQYAIRHGHDLLVKHVEDSHRDKGFKAADMALLRKCPCPVWLWRPQQHKPSSLRVGAAVDAQSPEREGRDLARHILKVAERISTGSDHPLQIVSCWDYEFEEYLRTNSWVKLPEEEINEAVAKAEQEHLDALSETINETDVSGETHQFRGSPSDVLPGFVTEHEIDVLVMGTVGRSGIPGFIIGNTAEAVLQEVTCSLLALKPAGFKSPVDAYEN